MVRQPSKFHLDRLTIKLTKALSTLDKYCYGRDDGFCHLVRFSTLVSVKLK
jgi:hypothetical protein